MLHCLLPVLPNSHWVGFPPPILPIQTDAHIAPAVISPKYKTDHASPHYSFNDSNHIKASSPNFLREQAPWVLQTSSSRFISCHVLIHSFCIILLDHFLPSCSCCCLSPCLKYGVHTYLTSFVTSSGIISAEIFHWSIPFSEWAPVRLCAYTH